jgi:hypothetical protein
MLSQFEGTLSVELVEQIASNLPPRDLAPLSRVNKSFRVIFQQILFKSISITRIRSGIPCLRVLCRRDDLARAVRRFSLFINPYIERYVDSLAIQRLLKDSIRLMSNLLELRIPNPHPTLSRDFYGGPIRYHFYFQPSIIADASAYLRLCDFSGLPHTGLPDDWFSDRPNIMELRIGSHIKIGKLNSAALPNLRRIFVDDVCMADFLLAGRQIEYLRVRIWESDELNAFETSGIHLLGLSNPHLKTFECFYWYYETDSLLRLLSCLSNHLPSLQSIGITVQPTTYSRMWKLLEVRSYDYDVTTFEFISTPLGNFFCFEQHNYEIP